MLFISDRDGANNLWSMAADGGERRQHTLQQQQPFDSSPPSGSGTHSRCDTSSLLLPGELRQHTAYRADADVRGAALGGAAGVTARGVRVVVQVGARARRPSSVPVTTSFFRS